MLSPDGKFLIVTTTGFRQFLSAVRISDGRVVSRIAFNGNTAGSGSQKDQLYYGLAFGGAKDGKTTPCTFRAADWTARTRSRWTQTGH